MNGRCRPEEASFLRPITPLEDKMMAKGYCCSLEAEKSPIPFLFYFISLVTLDTKEEEEEAQEEGVNIFGSFCQERRDQL